MPHSFRLAALCALIVLAATPAALPAATLATRSGSFSGSAFYQQLPQSVEWTFTVEEYPWGERAPSESVNGAFHGLVFNAGSVGQTYRVTPAADANAARLAEALTDGELNSVFEWARFYRYGADNVRHNSSSRGDGSSEWEFLFGSFDGADDLAGHEITAFTLRFDSFEDTAVGGNPRDRDFEFSYTFTVEGHALPEPAAAATALAVAAATLLARPQRRPGLKSGSRETAPAR